MEALMTFFEQYLDKFLFAIIILSGIYITRYATDILPKIGDRYKVLFISTLVAVILYFIEGGGRLTLPRYIFTYTFATSFYEIIAHWIILQVKNKFGTNEKEKQKTSIGGENPKDDDEDGGTN